MEQWCHTCVNAFDSIVLLIHTSTHTLYVLCICTNRISLYVRKSDTKASTACEMVGTVSRWYSCDTIFCCDRDQQRTCSTLSMPWLCLLQFTLISVFFFGFHNYAEHYAQFCRGKNKPQHKNGTYMISFFVCVHSLVCFLIKKLY